MTDITDTVNQTPQPSLESIPSVVNEPQIVVMPDGRKLTPEEYLKESSEETEREVKRAVKSRKSAFRTSRRFRAGSFTFGDTVFDYCEVPDSMIERYDNDSQKRCEEIGVSKEDLDANNLTSEQLGKIFEGMQPLIASVLKECVIDWDDVDCPFNPSLVVDIGYECKRALFTQIISSTKTGFSQNDFLAMRSSS